MRVLFFIDSLIILSALAAAFCYADAMALPASLDAILATRFTLSNIIRAAAVFTVWASSMHLLNVYRSDATTPASEALRIALSVGAASALLVATFGYQHKAASALNIAADFALFCVVALFAMRALVAMLSGGRRFSPRAKCSVIIVGSGTRAIHAYRELRTRQFRTHSLLGFVDRQPQSFTPGEIQSLYLGPLTNLEEILFKNVVDEVIIALPAPSCYAEIEQTIATCCRLGIEVKYTDDLFESARTFTPRNHRPPMVAIKPAIHDSRLIIKRSIDVIVSAAALIFLAPLFLFIAAAIKLSSPGPVFFLQERYGVGRRRFRMCKFRTMVADAEARLSAIEPLNEAHGPIFKMRSDPRVTQIGALLRRASLDELPQLFNVLTGHMALVGPRPMTIRDVGRFNEAWLMRRFSVKPGITCLWQVNGRSNTTFDRWIELDLHYIDNWSLGLDARILALTIPAVFKGSGAM